VELDDYERKTIDFISKNSGCNQNDIRNAGICSDQWAIKIVIRLVERGLIEDQRIGNGFHKYRVSDRKQYGRIKEQLQILDKQREEMETPLENIAKLQDRHDPAVFAYTQKLVIPYYQSMFAMLFRLLNVSDIDIGKEDSVNLRSQMISLIFKVVNQQYYNSDYKKILADSKSLLNNLRQELSESGTSNFVMNIWFLDNYIEQISEFEEKFG